MDADIAGVMNTLSFYAAGQRLGDAPQIVEYFVNRAIRYVGLEL
jgi:hypothetical protein